MSSETTLAVLLILGCLALSAFFSSSETAFFSLQRVRLQHLVASGVKGAGRVARIREHPEQLLSTVLLGNNIVNTLASALTTAVAISLLGSNNTGLSILVSTMAATAVIVIFGEVVPKAVAARYPERFAFPLARPIQVVEKILLPGAILLRWLSIAVLRMFGTKAAPRLLVSEEEIRTMVSIGAAEGSVDQSDAEMIHKVFKFGDLRASEVMTPRTAIVALEKATTLSQFLAVYSAHTHTRFPVYEGNPDNIVGILPTKQVFKAFADGVISLNNPVTGLVRPVHFYPETKSIDDLFAEMRSLRTQMVVLVDEHGGIAGLVTIKKLIEEIVGRAPDEGSQDQAVETIDAKTVVVDAGIRIDDANEKLGLAIPDGDYETLAGFVLKKLGHIPHEGEQVRHNGQRLVVTQIKGVKIERILVARG